MNDLQKILVIGAGLGLSHNLAAMFPEAAPAKPMTEADLRALDDAEAKRVRRALRNIAQEGSK